MLVRESGSAFNKLSALDFLNIESGGPGGTGMRSLAEHGKIEELYQRLERPGRGHPPTK